MTQVNIKVENEAVNAALTRLSSRLKTGMKPVYQAIQGEMIRDITDHFTDERGPNSVWKPLAEATIKQRIKKYGGANHGILKSTGVLRMSLLGKAFTDNVFDSEKAQVGTNLIYGATHNFGRDHIPQREFMYLSQKSTDAILKLIEKVIDKEWG